MSRAEGLGMVGHMLSRSRLGWGLRAMKYGLTDKLCDRDTENW